MIKAYIIIILMKDDKILLLKRAATGKHDDKWGFISGNLESGEFPSEAALREAKEEVGITIDKQDLQFGGVVFEKAGESVPMGITFFVDKWLGDVVNNEPKKHSELKWVSVEEFPQEVVPAHAMALEMTANELGLVEFTA